MITKKTLIGVTIVLLLFILPSNMSSTSGIMKQYNHHRKQQIRTKLAKLGIYNNHKLVRVIANNTITDDNLIDPTIAQGFKESGLRENIISQSGHDYGAWQENDQYNKFDKKRILTYDYACKRFITHYQELQTIYKKQRLVIKHYNGSGYRSERYAEHVMKIIDKINS